MKHRLKVWGDFACFTRPEMKVERASYDIITPSAARAVFEAILWNPFMKWHIEMIQVLNPIKWVNIRRNEVSSKASKNKKIFIEDERVQRSSLLLKNVAYVIHAELELIEPNLKQEKKFNEMFKRRASKGQCFTQPYLGCREFSSYFQLLDEQEHCQPILENQDLGLMLYDMGYNKEEISPHFFYATMLKGNVLIPKGDSSEILK
ncbi:MAG: type I-C CRISPR-associated protein Cas5c [Chlamydiota bacterium]